MSNEPVNPDPGRLEAVIGFLAARQAVPTARISYLGCTAEEIAAELDELDPPWSGTLRTVEHDGEVVGAALVEWDVELGRSWIHGPWTGPGLWDELAGPLLDSALAQTPDGVTRHELSGPVVNTDLAALAAQRGWEATEVNHVLRVDAERAVDWKGDPSLSPATAGDLDGIGVLHDLEFPGTYLSAGQLLVEPQVVLVARADDGTVVGYVAGKVDPTGGGYIDFVAVAPGSRRGGLGARLVTSLGRQLLDASPTGTLALTVRTVLVPARTLYRKLGFREIDTLVGYRSWKVSAD